MADRDDGQGGEDKKGFLKRWSRLKLEEAERQPAPAPVTAPPVEDAPLEAKQEIAPAEAETEDSAEAETEEPFDPADLPDIDSLDKDSDYTGFLKAGVPAQLRRMALQKLFRSDPALAVLDGLNDYDEDFTLAKVAEKIVSSYKPGRGYADDTEEEDEPEDIEAGEVETVDLEDADIEDDADEDSDGDETQVADADETEKGELET